MMLRLTTAPAVPVSTAMTEMCVVTLHGCY